MKYDRDRGYGFIAPDEGSEDIFVHVRDVNASEDSVAIGTRVVFSTEEGDRGLRAADVRIVDPAPVTQAAPAERLPVTHATSLVDLASAGHVISVPRASLAVPEAVPAPSTPAGHTTSVPADDDSVDVIPVTAFQREITDILLTVASSITAAQIMEIRDQLTRTAQSRGWIE